jgi:hypothetical protein
MIRENDDPLPSVRHSALSPHAGTRITDEERSSSHIGLSLERDTLSRSRAGELWTGSASWRYAPQSAMTIEVLVGVLLVCLGLLLGTSWTIQASQPKLRRQAMERRRLNEEWSTVRTARLQWEKCPRCGSLLSDQDWCYGSTIVKDQPDDD